MEVKIEMKNKLLTLVIPVLTVFLFHVAMIQSHIRDFSSILPSVTPFKSRVQGHISEIPV